MQLAQAFIPLLCLSRWESREPGSPSSHRTNEFRHWLIHPIAQIKAITLIIFMFCNSSSVLVCPLLYLWISTLYGSWGTTPVLFLFWVVHYSKLFLFWVVHYSECNPNSGTQTYSRTLSTEETLLFKKRNNNNNCTALLYNWNGTIEQTQLSQL